LNNIYSSVLAIKRKIKPNRENSIRKSLDIAANLKTK